eukprot:3685296-Alexandrium_andersonii.AAC.1
MAKMAIHLPRLHRHPESGGPRGPAAGRAAGRGRRRDGASRRGGRAQGRQAGLLRLGDAA